MHPVARRSRGRRGGARRRAVRHRDVPPALLLRDGGMGAPLRLPGAPARGRRGVDHAARPDGRAVGGRDQGSRRRPHADPMRRALRGRHGAALGGRRRWPRRAAQRRHRAGDPRHRPRRVHVQLSQPRPASRGGRRPDRRGARPVSVRADPRRLVGAARPARRRGGRAALGGALRPRRGRGAVSRRTGDRTHSTPPAKETRMAYEVPPLPYDYAALEPHVDEATMRVHHDKHHQAYVDKVNAALEGTDLADAPIEDVLKDLNRVPGDKRTAVRNNGGGHYNHSLFWEWMSPNGGGEPDGALRDAIDSAFGSFDDFKAKFKETGVNQFGSGWSWLVYDGSGLAVVGTPNQDNPISNGQTPLLGVDVWEHAYYLKYQNKRPDYIDAWWNVVNWEKVAERYAAVAG